MSHHSHKYESNHWGYAITQTPVIRSQAIIFHYGYQKNLQALVNKMLYDV